MKTNTDPIFAAHAATAPRLDLAFYLASAGRPSTAATFGPTTPAAICQMAATYAALCGTKPGPIASQKKRAWQAIAGYKASTIQPYGNAGVFGRPRFEPGAVTTFDVLDSIDARPGETLPAVLARYAAECQPDVWWPTDLSGAEIVDRALAAALRADAENERRALEPLIEADDVRS